MPVMKFKEKPEIIEAIQYRLNNDYNPEKEKLNPSNSDRLTNFHEIFKFTGGKYYLKDGALILKMEGVLGGNMIEEVCLLNDWIIKKPTGFIFLCEKEIFEKRFEKIN